VEEPKRSPTTISTGITGQREPSVEETDIIPKIVVETEISQPAEKAETKIPIEHPALHDKYRNYWKFLKN